MQEETTYIYGKHAVREVVEARPEIVKEVHIDHDTIDSELSALIEKNGIERKDLTTKQLPKGVDRDAVHQGHIAEIKTEKLAVPYEQFISELDITNDTAVVVLGEVQDPHNVGAIIRSAAALGMSAVLIPEHRQAQITGTVVKVSAGAAFRIPLVRIGNVNNVMRDLKEKGFWTYGLTGEGDTKLKDEGFEKPSCFVVGNEAGGIREKTLEHCDIQLTIPITGNTESLNASVAAGIAFYAWSAKHPFTA